ncbi:porin [Microvirga makkahensis]|uniref:Porin n=1 Tax=Microvirga makkahensis TaxID=1128670 RepID=A0A7X3MSU6_9HYPH|nr:porin [Microvirga makkahensis]MXQ12584.1 porin [Microvirga makkahensis]
MKLVKSLLLGSAAGLAAVAGAQAADLPIAKAAPVEYVRVCSTYGAGFFYIPGTETCLRVGGRVRADYLYVEPELRDDDAIGFRARGRIQVDARTATAYGLLRTFIRLEMFRDTGAFNAAPGTVDNYSSLDQAFVQFGGLTAGRALTFFDNGDIDAQTFAGVRWNDQPNVNLLAYTFSFGNGFSATLSLEEGEYAGIGLPPAFGDVTAGRNMPDVVANIRYAGTWGSAQLSGAVHQLRSVALTDAAGLGFIPDTEYGFAVSGQFTFNLPMLAAGDAVWLAATYADGALGYLGFGGADVDDAIIDADGDIDTTQGWSIAGGLRHYWTPEIRQNVFGSYASVEYGAGVVGADFTEWRAGTNLIWSPVSGLNIGAEVMYTSVDIDDVADDETDDFWQARLRVERNF